MLLKDGFCTRRLKDGKVTSYFYYEVESIKKFNTDQDETRFAFQLNFYAKEYGAKKKVLRFICEEHAIEEKNKKEFAKSETKEFAFLHIFERMLPLFWQQFFEKNLQIEGKTKLDGFDFEDCYQFHAFVLKKNTYFMIQRRFMVLTNLWMFNVDADFDKKTNTVVFKKMKWKVPIEAIIKADLSMTDDRITITLFTEKKKQNDILVQHGGKRINKDKRKLQFPDAYTARDFLFHIKRLHFQWNRYLLKVEDKTK